MDPTATTPQKKKPLFKRRAAPQTAGGQTKSSGTAQQGNSSDDELDIFRRSKQVFPLAALEQDQRTKVKSEKRKPGLVSEATDTNEQGNKRRKVAPVDDDSDDIYGVSDRELERRAEIARQ